ncbi:SPOR domain-containing protein [Desulfobotulus sp. H1]|uniref:SPOR domain-containing protein n=1 Tax=Desulfobotulus pelophilus TaxID=2823377 RepID=A0ABT3N8Y3_9BACT|nr:SPOR domain-containing protein [Desulfobotulus pelophilus]MCW7753900.1 SPOR domain-containing protein [Desulfobotulus pelophilus]
MVAAVRPINMSPPSSPVGNTDRKGDRDDYSLTAADTLLQNTGQRQQWQNIRQNNDALARKLAPLLMERNAMLAKARDGETIRWSHFDTLTAELGRAGIHLWDHNALLASGWQADSMPHNHVSGNGSHRSGPAAPTVPLPSASEMTQARSTGLFPQSILPPTAPMVPQKEEPAPSTEPDFLVLNATWERHTLASGLGAYGNPDQLFMPLGALAAILEVPLRVSPQTGKASGEVLGKNFELNLEEKTITLGRKTQTIPENAIIHDEDDIHIDAKVLKEWLPLDFDFSFREMAVRLQPKATFPFQERIERQQRWNRLGSFDGTAKPSILDEKTRPAFVSLPVVDLSLSASHHSRDNNPRQASYTLSGAGNLAGGTGHFYVRGDDTHNPRRVEARFEKTDPSGSLPLGATRFALGDVSSPSLPILGRAGTAQGILLENRSLYKEREFDSTRFEGNLAPGWEVELYRGTALMDVRRVGEDGRYLFDDVSLFYGTNDFRLIFYGPEGQRREENRRLEVGTDMLPRGQMTYSASLTRQDRVTYEENQSRNNDAGNAAGVGAIEYGLGERTTLSAGFMSDTFGEERRTRLQAGMETALTGASLRVDGVHTVDGGSALRLGSQTALNDHRIRASVQLQDKLEGDHVTNPVRSISELSLYGTLGKQDGFRLPYTLSGRYTDRDDSYESRISLLNSLRTGAVHWNHRISHDYNSASSRPESIQGSLHASTRMQSTHIRAHGDYRLDDYERGFTGAGLTATRHLTRDLDIQGSLNRDFTGTGRTYGDAQLNLRKDKLSISPGVSADDRGDWSVSLNMNMALGPDPHRQSIRPLPRNSSAQGLAAVRVFEDANGNGIMDGEEKGLEGVRVRAVQSGSRAVTDKDGIAFLQLSPHQKTDIVIEEESLEDPALYPLHPGEAVSPRPGEVRPLSLPVIRTGEIDGTLYGVNSSGDSVPLRQVEVLLTDKKGTVVDRVLSEYDGFYLFERVKPGQYTVKALLSQDNGTVLTRSLATKIDETGSIESGLDMVLKTQDRPETKASAPGPVPEEDEYVLFREGRWTDSPDPQTLPATRPLFDGPEAVLYREGSWVPGSLGAVPALQGLTENRILFAAEGRKEEEIQTKKNQPSAIQHKSPLHGRISRYGVHAGSYRSREKALEGIQWAKDHMPELNSLEEARIQPVDLGEKGLWYRVVLGAFENRAAADSLAAVMAEKSGYGRVLTAGSKEETAVHLASYTDIKDAEKGIILLERQFRTLMGNNLSMGITKEGSSYRVVVQNFKVLEDAEQFRQKVADMGGYARIIG